MSSRSRGLGGPWGQDNYIMALKETATEQKLLGDKEIEDSLW